MLVAVADRIAAAVRPRDLAARLGGDEFAVLLEDVDAAHGEEVAQRLLSGLSAPVLEAERVWVARLGRDRLARRRHGRAPTS